MTADNDAVEDDDKALSLCHGEDVVPLTKMDFRGEKQVCRSAWREEIPDEFDFEMCVEGGRLHSCSTEMGDFSVDWERS